MSEAKTLTIESSPHWSAKADISVRTIGGEPLTLARLGEAVQALLAYAPPDAVVTFEGRQIVATWQEERPRRLP